jgi:hypothetical protein
LRFDGGIRLVEAHTGIRGETLMDELESGEVNIIRQDRGGGSFSLVILCKTVDDYPSNNCKIFHPNIAVLNIIDHVATAAPDARKRKNVAV